MSKSFKFFVAIAIFISGVTFASGKLFKDVAPGHWAWDPIIWVSDLGVMTGPGDQPEMFDPAGVVNRAQLATVAQRLGKYIQHDSLMAKDVKALMSMVLELQDRVDVLEGKEGAGLSINTPIIDSDLTLAQALEGLSPECPIEVKERQVLVDVHYYSFDGKIHRGQIVVDKEFANDVKGVFDVIFKEKFPVASVIPVSKFAWSDETSMKANNTSGFNYRFIQGSTTLSNHARGWAVDINPYLNPYIRHKMGEEKTVEPAGAIYDATIPGTLTAESPVVKKFKGLGWNWGGEWSLPDFHQISDYQHFENEKLKPIEN